MTDFGLVFSWLIFHSTFTLAALWPPSYSDGSGHANLIPASSSLGYVCRVYCKYPMELGNGEHAHDLLGIPD